MWGKDGRASGNPATGAAQKDELLLRRLDYYISVRWLQGSDGIMGFWHMEVDVNLKKQDLVGFVRKFITINRFSRCGWTFFMLLLEQVNCMG